MRFDVPEGDPRWGKLHRCPNFPIEHDYERQDRIRELSNLEALKDKTFESFRFDNDIHTENERELLRKAYEASRAFARHPEGWLLMVGTYGSGKTHLAAAIGNECLQHGMTVLFITSPDLLDHLRTGFSEEGTQSYDEVFERIKSCELLILDDLGVENPSAWAKEKLFQLLNHRYTYNLPTVVTTNADIDRLDPRIGSRLMDSGRANKIRFDVRDYRLFGEESSKGTTLSSRLNIYRDYTFKKFDVQTNIFGADQENLAKVATAAGGYARNPEGRWIVFAGKSGTGKTHLAAAIANYRQGQRDDTFFIGASDLLDELRVTFGAGIGPTFEQRFEKVKNVGLLVLDDLNMGTNSDWAREKLFQLIEYRYVSRRATVFTVSDVEAVSERVRMRLFDERICSTYEITAPPYIYRIRQK